MEDSQSSKAVFVPKETKRRSAQIRAGLGDSFLSLRIKVLMAEDGSEQFELLEMVGYFVLIALRVSARVKAEEANRSPVSKVMVQGVVASWTTGKWRANWALEMVDVIELATDYICDYNRYLMPFLGDIRLRSRALAYPHMEGVKYLSQLPKSVLES